MEAVGWSLRALADVQRLHQFLHARNPAAAERATATIQQAADGLVQFPERGRRLDGSSKVYRELLVEFGSSGYAILYEMRGEQPYILAIKHFREEGYS